MRSSVLQRVVHMKRIFISAMLWVFAIPLSFGASVEKTRLSSRVSGTFQTSPQAALNSQTGRTLVLWQQHHGQSSGSTIFGHFLDSDGSPIGKTFRIVKGPKATNSRLIYDPA